MHRPARALRAAWPLLLCVVSGWQHRRVSILRVGTHLHAGQLLQWKAKPGLVRNCSVGRARATCTLRNSVAGDHGADAIVYDGDEQPIRTEQIELLRETVRKNAERAAAGRGPETLIGFFGHEPAWKRPSVYGCGERCFGHVHFAVHWAPGADVRTLFLPYTRHYASRTAGVRWWEAGARLEKTNRMLALDQLGRATSEEPRAAFLVMLGGSCLPPWRGQLVRALRARMPEFASIGLCERTGKLGEPSDQLSARKRLFSGLSPRPRQYRKLGAISFFDFYLVVESTRREAGWITEKLFECLAAGVVPVFVGRPRSEVEPLMPAPEAFLHLDDFSEGASAAHAERVDEGALDRLVQRLRALHADRDAYARLHAWRQDGPRTAAWAQRLQAVHANGVTCRVCHAVDELRRRTRKVCRALTPSLGWQPIPCGTSSEWSLRAINQRYEQEDEIVNKTMAAAKASSLRTAP